MIGIKEQLYATIDDEDYELIKDYNWWAGKASYTFYANARIKKNGMV